MAKGKGRTRAAEAPASNVEAPAPAAVIEVQAATPVSKRGKSTIQTPVATVWVTCHNMVSAAKKAGEAIPSRKALVAASIDQGIAFYTARTQVQAYLKASKNGTQVPDKLPRNVSITA